VSVCERGRTAALLTAAVLLAAADASAQIYTRRKSNGVVEATNVPTARDFRLTYPGKGRLIHSRGFRSSYSGQYDLHVEEASAHHGVSPALVKAVIQVESEWDALAVSSKGARGLMQLMPFTAERFGVSDSFDARQNIFGGVRYLRLLLDLFGGDIDLALAGYNAGENAVLRYGGIPPYKETRGYVQKIQSLLTGVSSGLQGLTASFFAPATVRPPQKTRARAVVPARPRAYSKWTDETGIIHVASSPPPEGVVYSMIRALD
jgi:soluble lytic murein transglycosylase-like protein